MSLLYGIVIGVLGLALAVILGIYLYERKEPAKALEAVTKIGQPIKA